MLVRVVVGELEPGLRVLHVDAELLVELAVQRGKRRLAGLALAARKLPQARHVSARAPLVHEPAPPLVGDQAHEHVHAFRALSRQLRRP